MKVKIETLGELKEFLDKLTPQQLEQKVLIPGDYIDDDVELEGQITDEDFLRDKEDASNIGYETEMQAQCFRQSIDYNPKNYIVDEPKGTVIFRLK